MEKGNNKRFTKEEELEFGRIIQEGKAAQETLENNSDLDSETLKELNAKVSEALFAREELFEANIPFANRLAIDLHRKAGTSYPLDDLVQDAYGALYEATNTYNPKMNCVLRTHAYYKISKVLSVTINKMRAIRLPENKMGDYLHITRAEAEFSRMHNGVFDAAAQRDYVSEKTGISSGMISLIKDTIMGTISLNAPLGEDGGEFGDLIRDENVFPTEIENPLLADLLSGLSEYERDLIAFEMQVGIPSTSMSEFLQKHNLTEVELSKATKKVIRSLAKKAK